MHVGDNFLWKPFSLPRYGLKMLELAFPLFKSGYHFDVRHFFMPIWLSAIVCRHASLDPAFCFGFFCFGCLLSPDCPSDRVCLAQLYRERIPRPETDS